MRSLRRNGKNPTIWALQDVSFEVKRERSLALSGVTVRGNRPAQSAVSNYRTHVGRIELYGRVASLLEVGTGFHPELTGRENIFLNGSILGMSRKEIEISSTNRRIC